MIATSEALAAIPDLAEEAEQTRGTQPISIDGERRRATPGSRCLADLDRMLALDDNPDGDGIGVVSGWVRHIITEQEEAGLDPQRPADDLAECCAWIASRLDWCAGRGWDEDMADDIRRLHSTLSRITRHHSKKPWACLTGGCPGTMRLQGMMLVCQLGHEHPGLDAWRNHPPMPVPEVVTRLGIPQYTVSRMIASGSVRLASEFGTNPTYVWPWDCIKARWPEAASQVEEGKDVA